MDLFSASTSCDALLLSSWLEALADGATRLLRPSVESLLDAVPSLQNLASECATVLTSKGVPDLMPMSSLCELAEKQNLASKWRPDACSRYI